MIPNSFSGATSTPTITDKQFTAANARLEDSVACLAWVQEENRCHLLSSTWDGNVSLLDVCVRDAGAEVPSVSMTFQTDSIVFGAPCISLAWQSRAKKIIAGSIDGSIYLKDPNTLDIQTIGKHDDAVKGIYYIKEIDLICSLSYDKTMKFWDLRAPGPCSSFNLGAKAVCSDLLFPNIAVGLSNEKLLIFDILRDISAVFRNIDNHYIGSPLGSDSPLSAVSISKENTIGIGTYDGRSNLSKFERRSDGTTGLENIVTFKAHKIDPGQNGNTSDLKILYPIHAVGLHPRNRNTYFTAGGDGCVNFWDIPARNKLSFFTCTNTPITAAKYSHDGKLLAYAYGYDWAKGIEGSKSIKPRLHIHSTQLDELARVE